MDGINNFCHAEISCKAALSVLYIYEPGPRSIVFYLFTLAKKAKYDESLVGLQMIKLLAQPTRNAVQFCGERK